MFKVSSGRLHQPSAMGGGTIPNDFDGHLWQLYPQALKDIDGRESVRVRVGQNPDLPQIVEIETIKGDFCQPWRTGEDPKPLPFNRASTEAAGRSDGLVVGWRRLQGHRESFSLSRKT